MAVQQQIKSHYVRSRKELIETLKTTPAQQHAGGNNTLKEMFTQKGGSENIESFSTVPRDTQQVHRHAPPKNKRNTDFVELMKMNMEGSFVKSFELNKCPTSETKPRTFMCDDRTITDLRHYCCDDRYHTPLTIDPTYEKGAKGSFLLTASAYRHPMFINKGNQKHVLMPGPMMMHLKRNSETYQYYGKNISQQMNDQSICAFGTDGEKALVNGLRESKSFINSPHMLCTIHHRSNCETKLSSQNERIKYCDRSMGSKLMEQDMKV